MIVAIFLIPKNIDSYSFYLLLSIYRMEAVAHGVVVVAGTWLGSGTGVGGGPGVGGGICRVMEATFAR